MKEICSFVKISTVGHYVNNGTGVYIHYVLYDDSRNLLYISMLDTDGY